MGGDRRTALQPEPLDISPTAERPSWGGTATELAAALQVDMKPNALAMRLNVRAGKLATDYHIRYENTRTHAGRSISLTLDPPQA